MSKQRSQVDTSAEKKDGNLVSSHNLCLCMFTYTQGDVMRISQLEQRISRLEYQLINERAIVAIVTAVLLLVLQVQRHAPCFLPPSLYVCVPDFTNWAHLLISVCFCLCVFRVSLTTCRRFSKQRQGEREEQEGHKSFVCIRCVDDVIANSTAAHNML